MDRKLYFFVIYIKRTAVLKKKSDFPWLHFDAKYANRCRSDLMVSSVEPTENRPDPPKDSCARPVYPRRSEYSLNDVYASSSEFVEFS